VRILREVADGRVVAPADLAGVGLDGVQLRVGIEAREGADHELE
jgi:hypothetical protein